VTTIAQSDGHEGNCLALWSVAALVARVPGTTRRIWLGALVPQLVAAGVLRKQGRGWFGRWFDIENALLGRLDVKRGR
jgi:hypothetical protein